jgi:hypothetical protein
VQRFLVAEIVETIARRANVGEQRERGTSCAALYGVAKGLVRAQSRLPMASRTCGARGHTGTKRSFERMRNPARPRATSST